LLLFGDKSKDARLMSGDVIFIPPVGPQVALSGSVNMPAIYELKTGSALSEALQLAGGLTPTAAKQSAIIERVEGSARTVVSAPLEGDSSSAVALHSGDIITVRAIVPRFENTVTLRGNVADPVRLPWYPGMKIRDLIPDREALLTRGYWRAHNRIQEVVEQDGDNADGSEAASALKKSGASSADRASTDSRAGAVATEYGLDTPEAQRNTGGKRNAPSSIGAVRPESPAAKNRIQRNALEVNWSYAVIERRDSKDLRVSLIPFNLGKAIIDGDDSQNLALEAGDVVTIFSTADLRVPQALQTRYVRLEGEFQAAGVYSVRPGETLRQLVKRAGGLTPEAYLFGSEFLREASRQEQQQRLDDFVNSLERQVESAAANMRGSVISAEEAAAATSQVTGQRELVAKLREVRATGRIVLNLDPRVPNGDAVPDLPLEDGDVFVVPSKPAFVNVVGSVYNGTSFLYDGDKRVGDYLRESGKPTRTADSRHIFLIRADGSVVSKAWGSGIVHESFDNLRLNPGDTIVVPEQINKTTFLKSLKDWSQVFAQFGLGAAAINVLR
jgi:protein involved in polysaccharide export with SLBB domain